MAEYTKASLQRLRESAGLTRKVAAPLLGMSEDTLRRIEDISNPENRTRHPISGDLARMEVVYRVPGLWYNYHHTNDDAFREHLPELPEYNTQGALISFFVEAQEAIQLERDALKDAADGKVDSPDIRRKLAEEVSDVVAAGILLLNILKGGRA